MQWRAHFIALSESEHTIAQVTSLKKGKEVGRMLLEEEVRKNKMEGQGRKIEEKEAQKRKRNINNSNRLKVTI